MFRNSKSILAITLAAVLVVLAAALSGFRSPAVAQTDPGAARWVPDEILIKFRQEAREADRLSGMSRLDAQRWNTFRSGAERWRIPSHISVQEAIATMRDDPLVEYAEPNYLLTLYDETIPIDPDFSKQWALKNTGQSGCNSGVDIDATHAWVHARGSTNTAIAVIDTGIDYLHNDLSGNIWTNPVEVTGNGVDEDGCGYLNDHYGYDWALGDSDPREVVDIPSSHSHGTRVAGIIGAVTDNIRYLPPEDSNNPVGIAGINWDVRLMALRITPADSDEAALSNAILAIEYATCMRVDAINASWGGVPFSQTLKDAIDAAGEKEILFVNAAGNSGCDIDVYDPNRPDCVEDKYPMKYDSENLIVVADTTCDDELGVSNRGYVSVDLGAPGTNIYSTISRGTYDPLYKYAYASATSFAAPQVTGVAGLLRSLSPGMPAELVRRRIMDTTVHMRALERITVSEGRLNAYNAVLGQDTNSPTAIANLSATPHMNSVDLAWTATGDDGANGTAAKCEVRYATASINSSNWLDAKRVGGEPTPASPSSSESFTVDGLLCGTTYYFAVRAFDEWGNGPLSNIGSTTTTMPLTGDQSYCREESIRCDMTGCGPGNCYEYDHCVEDESCTAQDPCPSNACDC